VETECSDVDAIDNYLALAELNQSEDCLEDGRLSSTRAADDADLLARLDRKIEPLQRWLKSLSVAHRRGPKDNLAIAWPVFLRSAVTLVNGFVFLKLFPPHQRIVSLLDQLVFALEYAVSVNALRTREVVGALGDEAQAD
jgi:hypothetical protein